MNVLIPLAEGCEEMEAVIVADVLRRAGWEVTLAGLTEGPITASRGVGLMPDRHWDDIDPDLFEMIVLPGGLGGTRALCAHSGVQQTLRTFDAGGKWIAAVCAAPLALHEAGILRDRRFTCYPGIEYEMDVSVQRLNDSVVVDGMLITSQGPGTAFEFALKLIETGDGPVAAETVRKGLLL